MAWKPQFYWAPERCRQPLVWRAEDRRESSGQDGLVSEQKDAGHCLVPVNENVLTTKHDWLRRTTRSPTAAARLATATHKHDFSSGWLAHLVLRIRIVPPKKTSYSYYGSEQEFVEPLNWRALGRLGPTAGCRLAGNRSFAVASRSDGDLFARPRRHRQCAEAQVNCRIPLIELRLRVLQDSRPRPLRESDSRAKPSLTQDKESTGQGDRPPLGGSGEPSTTPFSRNSAGRPPSTLQQPEKTGVDVSVCDIHEDRPKPALSSNPHERAGPYRFLLRAATIATALIRGYASPFPATHSRRRRPSGPEDARETLAVSPQTQSKQVLWS
jgi:hypothetical protein